MIHTGDAIEVMAGMPAESVDAVCTDPPYGIEFMGKKWDAAKPAGFDKRTRDNAGAVDGAYARLLDRGPMQYVAGQSFQAWCEAWGREALRVTKPGGYLLAFGGTRTHHRLVCGLEDAGWIIRDELDWIYGTGFPKGRANLKPAHEPIVLARKPGPLQHLEIDRCRIPSSSEGNVPNRTALIAESAESQSSHGGRAFATSSAAEHVPWLPVDLETSTDTPKPDIGCSPGMTTEPSTTSGSTASSGRTPTVQSQRAASSTTSTRTDSTTDSTTSSASPKASTPESIRLSVPSTPSRSGTIEPDPSAISSEGSENLSGSSPDAPAGRWPSNVLVLAEDAELFDVANPYVVGSGATAGDFTQGRYRLPDRSAPDAMFAGGRLDAGNTYTDTGGYSRFFIIPQRYNGTCVSCGRAISADSPSYRLSPSADSAPSDAPTSPAGTPDSTAPAIRPMFPGTYTTMPSGATTWQPSPESGTTATPPSKPPETSPASTPLSSPAKSQDAANPATGTTTTTPSRSMCATCAEAITSPTTSDSDDLPPDYPRFLIIPKADRGDREPVLRGQLDESELRTMGDGAGEWSKHGPGAIQRENSHPTVKPTDLMRHLVRLVTPPGGTVLDPFLGSGSTAIACELEGFLWIGIEKEPEYVAIAEARLNGTQRGLGLDVGAPVRKRKVAEGVWTTERGYDKGQDWYNWREDGETPPEEAA